MGEKGEDTSPDAAEFRCLVPFPDGSHSFVHGFEAGMIWQRLMAGENPVGGGDEIAKHVENAEVFRRMGYAAGYDVTIEELDARWINVEFVKRPKRFGVIAGGKS